MGYEVNEVINNICDKLGILASELIPEMGKMKTAELGVWLVMLGVMVLLSVVMFLLSVRADKYDDHEFAGALVFFSGLLLVIAIIGLLLVLPNFMGWKASPTAKTFEYVLEHVEG